MEELSIKKPLLEVCVDSLRSAIAAERGGAMRLELCQDLAVGGTTPSEDLFNIIREQVNLPIRVLIRPHAWDFCYDRDEADLICRSIRRFCSAGADGVVTGALTPEGDIDLYLMRCFINAAGGLPVTFHRAFDYCRNPIAALEDIITLGGIDTVLTSGQAPSAGEGALLLKELIRQADGRVTILAGGGVRPEDIPVLYRETGIRAFHLSGKKDCGSRMRSGQNEIALGQADRGLSRTYTDEGTIRAARQETDRLVLEAASNLSKSFGRLSKMV